MGKAHSHVSLSHEAFKALQGEVIEPATGQSEVKAEDKPVNTCCAAFKDKIAFKAMDKLAEAFKIAAR